MAVEAVPTTYKAVSMRSMLEADWAATLDHYGIAWTYEPCLFALESGEHYLPDFLLHDLDTFVEVKGTGVPGAHKPAELAAELPPGAIVIVGLAPGRRQTGPYRWERYLMWRDASRFITRFGRCQECSSWQWFRPQLSKRCRNCRSAYLGFLASPGEMPFRIAPTDRPLRTTGGL